MGAGAAPAVVELDTGVANARSRAFYARLGYMEESVKLVKALGEIGSEVDKPL